MSDNKELNDNLEKLFSTIRDAYGIASMIKYIKEKEVGNKVKDYEILSFAEPEWNEIEYYKKDAFGLFKNSLDDYEEESKLIKKHPIQSVKRLSDNEVFSIGDHLTGFDLPISEITLFPSAGGILLKCGYNSWTIDGAEKVKERVPLFTTEDGKEIFEGDRCWYVSSLFKVDFYDFNVIMDREADLEYFPDIYKYFSTEDKAKSFLLLNKPELSLKEVQDVLLNFDNWDKSIGSNRINFEKVNAKLITLVNKKLTNQ